MSTVLEARDLKRTYTQKRGFFSAPATVKALDGVSFTLESGKTLAVVGESGSGKSTLARLLTLIELPSAGNLLINGEDVAQKTDEQRQALRQHVQIVFQNPYSSLNPRQKIGAALEEPLLINTNMSAKQRETAAREMMLRVGLRPEFYDRYPHMFSGGQRQRIAIARALMMRPKILVLDEPVSALDVSIQAQVVNLLKDLQTRLGLAFLFIAHDLAVVKHVADRVAVMYLGQIVEIAGKEALFAAPSHPYTRTLLAAIPRPDPHRVNARQLPGGDVPSPMNPPDGCRFHTRCPFVIDRCRHEAPMLRPTGDAHFTACHRADELPPAADLTTSAVMAPMAAKRLALYAARRNQADRA